MILQEYQGEWVDPLQISYKTSGSTNFAFGDSFKDLIWEACVLIRMLLLTLTVSFLAVILA